MRLFKASAVLSVLLVSAVMVLGVLSPGIHPAQGVSAPTTTVNGDINCDGKQDVTDAISLLQHLFLDGPPPCEITKCPPTILPLGTTPGRFVDNKDGTVSDTLTGLMWQKTPPAIKPDWKGAVAYCQALDLAGHTDWRLPNVRELDSLVDYFDVATHAIDPVFDNPLDRYWTITPFGSEGSGFAYTVRFDNSGEFVGSQQTNQTSYHVRAVR